MSLSLHGYSRGYDYQDLYHYLQWGYKQENLHESLDFDYFFDDKAAMNEGRDLYDWLGNSHTKRGDIKIELTSPRGTKSVLLPYRKYDFVNENGYVNWPFMTVHHWGESPVGTWTLKISFKSLRGYVTMSDLGVTLYGVASTPASVRSIPSTCNAACARGCSGAGQGNCDTCRYFRVAETLECVDNCPSNTVQHKKYCLSQSDSPDTSPDNTSPLDNTSPPDNTSPQDKLSATSGSSNVMRTVGLSVSLPVVFIVVLVVIFIIAGVYYWKRKARSTQGFHFIPLKQEPENV